MKKPAIYAAMTLLTVSLGACTWLAKTRSESARPADASPFGSIVYRAAEAAGGQRVLAILAKQGTDPVAHIFETAHAPEGQRPYAPTAESGDPLAPALQTLADAAAADFLADRRLNEETVKALTLFGVSIVAATDGTSPILPEMGERDPGVAPAPEVPGLRVRAAAPVWMFLAEEPAIASGDPIGFRRALRIGQADFLDTDDAHGPWCYAVTINAAQDGEFLFGRGAAGIRVTVDGAPAPFRTARVPVLLVKMPAGRHRVEVAYGEPQTARNVIAIAATAGAVIAFIALWLGLRPHPEKTAES